MSCREPRTKPTLGSVLHVSPPTEGLLRLRGCCCEEVRPEQRRQSPRRERRSIVASADDCRANEPARLTRDLTLPCENEPSGVAVVCNRSASRCTSGAAIVSRMMLTFWARG